MTDASLKRSQTSRTNDKISDLSPMQSTRFCPCLLAYRNELLSKGFPFLTAHRVRRCAFGRSADAMYFSSAYLPQDFVCPHANARNTRDRKNDR